VATRWTLTIDCAQPGRLAEFWALALGYEPGSPPGGFETWEQWHIHHGVPEEEWDDGAFLTDPGGIGPSLSFLKVPESKVVKNRIHLDVQVGGGRDTAPYEVRWPRVLEAKERLVAAGATVIAEIGQDGRPDHLMMADPEGNEFDLL
jgi:glyoxalase superfamily protein